MVDTGTLYDDRRMVDMVFTSTTVDRRYLPGRGILCSLLVHASIAFGLLSISTSDAFSRRPRLPLRVTMIDLRDPNYRMYLPLLGGGDPDLARAPEKLKASHTDAASPSASRAKGRSYPGPQPIQSDFPKPTNHIETVLQPTIKDPPILQPPSYLPNIVRMAETISVPPVLAPPKMPEIVKTPEPDPPAPLLVQPEMKVAEPPKLALASANLPKVALLPVTVQNAEPLLVLSPLPPLVEEPVNLPVGEARGRFTISPEPNPAGSEPGSKVGADLAAADGNAGAGKTVSTSTGAKDKDSNNGAGADNSRGTRGGSTSGDTPGSGAGSTSGASAGNGKDAFPGITILGGTMKGGTAGSSNSTLNTISINGNPRSPQASYGITILSTETSGGGLPQFGVFSNEQIYTVYLDMRRTATDPAPSWTFEYAVLKGTADPANPNKTPGPRQSQSGLVLPFPISKERPAFPEELVRKYGRRRIIVYAVISADGKVEQVTVKESPDTLLNEPVLRALGKWSFRPARLDGESVAVKVLMGIPLFLAP